MNDAKEAKQAPAVAWLHAQDPREAISDQKKRDMIEHNGLPGKRAAELYSIPCILAEQAPVVEADDRELDTHLIDRMSKLLAEIALILNSEAAPHSRPSYHDLPDKVRALQCEVALLRGAEAPAVEAPAQDDRISMIQTLMLDWVDAKPGEEAKAVWNRIQEKLAALARTSAAAPHAHRYSWTTTGMKHDTEGSWVMASDVAAHCAVLAAPAVEAGARDELAAFDVALDALDEYQRNWDTGAHYTNAQTERIAMECAVEAVRDALNDARATLARASAPEETTYEECMASMLDRMEAAEADAFRYRYLRERPLEAIDKGGVFAGRTPDNVVLNGADLDKAIDDESGVRFPARASEAAAGKPMTGWKLIPARSTPEMLQAFKDAYKGGSIWTDRIDYALEQFIAAAPQPASDPTQGSDAIARSKRILALVDDYTNVQSKENRDALRHALLDEFTQPAREPSSNSLESALRRLSNEAENRRTNADNPNIERIWLGMRDAYDIAANMAAKTGVMQPASEQQPLTFQSRVRPWMLECFGAEIAADRVERNHRFFEEAAELVQACGMTASEAHQLVDYTWSRPVGDPNQEAGGVMVTLAALCLASGLDMHAAGETELARINRPEMVMRIRAKQAAKPKHSPLPEPPASERQAARESIHVMAERAAKAWERESCKQFEWSDEQFEIWWNEDDRCRRADRIAEAQFILLAAKGDGHADD